MSNRICTNCGWALDFKQKIGKVFCLLFPKIFKKYYSQDWHRAHCIPEMKLCSLVLKSYIHVSVTDLYIPRIGQPIWLHQK